MPRSLVYSLQGKDIQYIFMSLIAPDLVNCLSIYFSELWVTFPPGASNWQTPLWLAAVNNLSLVLPTAQLWFTQIAYVKLSDVLGVGGCPCLMLFGSFHIDSVMFPVVRSSQHNILAFLLWNSHLIQTDPTGSVVTDMVKMGSVNM